MSEKPFDTTKPAQTRDGRKAVICANNMPGEFRHIGYVMPFPDDDPPFACIWNDAGKNPAFNRDCDLINIPTKHEGWVNIYPSNRAEICIANTSPVYSTKECADLIASFGRIACVRIEWEE